RTGRAGSDCRLRASTGGYRRYMARPDAPHRARWLLAVTALTVAAAGLAAATKGAPASAPTQPASTTQAGAEPCTFSGATDAAQGAADSPTRLLTDVRVGVHDCYERVTFEFKPRTGDAAGPVAWKAAYETGPVTEDA